MIKHGFCKRRAIVTISIVMVIFLRVFCGPLSRYTNLSSQENEVATATQTTRTYDEDNDVLQEVENKSSLVKIQLEPNAVMPINQLEEFQISLQNDPACEQLISDNTLVHIASVMAQQWLFQNTSEKEWETIEKSWKNAVQVCHGPIPEDLHKSDKLTARNWLQSAVKCANRTYFQESSGNEFCSHWWNHHAGKDFGTNTTQNLVRLFAKTARCGLHLEFPLNVIASESPPKPTLRQKGWRPRKVILISLTLGRKGAQNGCNLLRTAFLQGWDVVFAEGQFTRLHFKYQYTLQALDIALNKSLVPLQETLVVFADSFDVLAQKTPNEVVEAFIDQPHQIIWSAEEACYPMASWPYSLGIKEVVCDKLYPLPQGHSLRETRQFVNAGGWFGVGSAARRMLVELSDKVNQAASWQRFRRKHIREPLEDKKDCYLYGTDQVLSNAIFLKHQDRIGLDSRSAFFASSPGNFLGRSMNLTGDFKTGNIAWCHKSSPADSSSSSEILCPAFLHFNGGAQTEDFGVAMEGLSNQSTCRKMGSLMIVNIDSGTSCQASPDATPHCKWPCRNFYPNCSQQ